MSRFVRVVFLERLKMCQNLPGISERLCADGQVLVLDFERELRTEVDHYEPTRMVQEP